MINYSGDIGVSGSITASNGDRAVISGDFGIDMSLTYNGSQTGTGTETVGGSLRAVIYYQGGGSAVYTLPFGPLTSTIQVQQGTVSVTTETVTSANGIVVTVSGSGTVIDNLAHITETITARGSGSYQGVSFTETIHATGTINAAPPSQNTKVATGYISGGYTLGGLYGNISIASGGGIGGSGLLLDTAGAVINAGTVKSSGGGAAVNLTTADAHSVSNSGVILGGSTGINAAAGGALTVANYGLIQAAATLGVALIANGAGSVSNHGTMLGGAAGINAGGALTLSNYGLIQATAASGVALIGSGAGMVSNHGTILGGAGGLKAGAGGALTIANYGLISGGGGPGVVLGSTSDRLIVGQKSTIVGGAQGGGGMLYFASSLANRYDFPTVTGLGSVGTVTGDSQMTFSGFGDYAVGPGAELVLTGDNTLAAGKTLDISKEYARDGSVEVIGTLINAGTIAGGFIGVQGFLQNNASAVITGTIEPGAAGATFKNFGTVIGTGYAYGVEFNSQNERLIVAPGSTIVGGASGGGYPYDGGTLEVTGGTGAITGVNEQSGTLTGSISLTYSNFENLILDAGGSWTLSGASTPYLTSFGTLTIAQNTGVGNVTIAGGKCTLASGASLANSYISLWAGSFVITAGVVGPTGWNQSGGTLSIAVGASLSLTASPQNNFEAGDIIGGLVNGAGTLSLGGTETISSGTVLTVAAIQGDSHASVTFDASVSYAGVWSQTVGLLTVAAGATLTLKGRSDSFTSTTFNGAGGVAFVGGADLLTSVFLGNTSITNAAVTLSGTIFNGTTLSVSTGYLQIAAAGATLTNRGSLVLSNRATNRIHGLTSTATLFNQDNTISGAGDIGGGSMSLVNSGVIDGDQSLALILDTGAQTILNTGIIEASGAGGVTVRSAISGRGQLTADGGVLTLEGKGSAFTGNNFAGTNDIVLLGGSDVLSGITLTAAEMTLSNAAVTLAGSITDVTTISVSTPNLIIASSGATLTGGGTLVLTDRATNRVVGATATATLTNANDTISGAGALGGGSMRLANHALIVGDQSIALTIDTGAATIANVGTIASAGAGGVIVKSALANTGLLEALAGTLTLDGPITGAGHAMISGGTLVAAGAFTEAVTFGASGTLTLAASQAYTGKITGFSLTGATVLDLRDIAFVNAAEAHFSGTKTGGVLTVTDGTHTAKINLVGDFTASTFIASSDGHGGVKIIDPTTPPSPQAFAAGMASLASSTSDASPAATPPPTVPLLARPLG